jgi:hypothetical protein
MVPVSMSTSSKVMVWGRLAAVGDLHRAPGRHRGVVGLEGEVGRAHATTTSSHTGLGRGRAAAGLMPRFYSNPRSAANPARITQATRAMATVSRNRCIVGP